MRSRTGSVITRRQFTSAAGLTVASIVVAATGCRAAGAGTSAEPGRLSARAGKSPRSAVPSASERTITLGNSRDAVLRIPDKVATPVPLLLLLHGAGGSGERMLSRVRAFTDGAGIAVLSPSSVDSTWDAIRGDFSDDVTRIDKALKQVFSEVPVDPARVFVGGFSDGASYALSLGLINGDLFSKILAFSPGFIVQGAEHGRPRIFISHGVEDQILPFERCGKRLATELKSSYDVTFRQFQGGHEIPPEIGKEAMDWAVGGER